MNDNYKRYNGLGTDALVAVCSWNTNVIMVWACTFWSPYSLGTRALLWFGHECSGHRTLVEHEQCSGLGMVALVTVCSRNANVINYGLGMEALVTVCSWNMNGYARGTRTLLCFGHDAMERSVDKSE